MYDLVILGKKRVNWVVNFDDCNWILNNECKEEFGWKIFFEIYYGWKFNLFVKVFLECVDLDDNDVIISVLRKWELVLYGIIGNKIWDGVKFYSVKFNNGINGFIMLKILNIKIMF